MNNLNRFLTKSKCERTNYKRALLVLFVLMLILNYPSFVYASQLHFRIGTEASPSEPMPSADADHNQEASWLGGSWYYRSMLLDDGGATSESHNTTTGGGNGMYRGVSFISEALQAESPGADTWTVHIHGYKSTNAVTIYPRAYIYEWNSGDTKGEVVGGPTAGSAYTTSDAGYDISISGSAITIAANNKIVVDVYYNVTGGGSGTRRGYLLWGKAIPGSHAANSDEGYLNGPGSLISTLGWLLLAVVVIVFLMLAIRKGDLRVKRAAVTAMLVPIILMPSTLKTAVPNPDVYLTVKGRKIPLHAASREEQSMLNKKIIDSNRQAASKPKA